MPPTSAKTKPCSHTNLQLEPSAYAAEAGFTWSSPKQRFAATTKIGRAPITTSRGTRNADAFQKSDPQPSTFPGPLVLPWDDLGWDPDDEGQNFKSWYEEPHRNKPTAARKTLYVFDVPEITEDVKFMDAWTHPQLPVTEKNGLKTNTGPVPIAETTPAPKAQDIVEYLSAFYHGLPTKLYPQQLRFVLWEEKTKPSKKKKQQPQPQQPQQPQQQQYIGLSSPCGLTTRIRARPSPDALFPSQLNLEDILDFAIATLPSDAYALALLTHHDLYEDEADDFCCGRAYGGSRVSVVSTARYRPEMDEMIGLDRDHMWPASHCRAYVERLCEEDDIHVATREVPALKDSPMREAVRAASALSHQDTPAMWFSRVVRTVSHELGHCLALGHCIYYACLMQSTAGVKEDVRQPPYLCPVCEGKVAWMVAVEVRKGGEEGRKAYLRERHEALEGVCGRWEGVGMFAGYKAWLGARVGELEG